VVLNFKRVLMEKINQIKKELIREAIDKHGKIFPPGHRENLDDECFTQQDNTLIFWFNIENNSTKTLMREVEN